MNTLEILSIGIGLSMDAFAVSICSGINCKKNILIKALVTAMFFGFFQGIMPFLGWLTASSIFRELIEKYDKLTALILLFFIGFKMIFDELSEGNDTTYKNTDSLIKLLFLSIATSIDAFMVGITFTTNFKGLGILNPVSIIGLSTFLISFAGVFIGKKTGSIFEDKSAIAGGIILIIMGLKIYFI